jgi:hypothetical protein
MIINHLQIYREWYEYGIYSPDLGNYSFFVIDPEYMDIIRWLLQRMVVIKSKLTLLNPYGVRITISNQFMSINYVSRVIKSVYMLNELYDLCQTYNVEFVYTDFAFASSSCEMLSWWLDKFGSRVIEFMMISLPKHNNWKSIFELIVSKCEQYCIDKQNLVQETLIFDICYKSKMDMLNYFWERRDTYGFPMGADVIDSCGSPEVLDWIMLNRNEPQINFTYTTNAIDTLCDGCNELGLKWWFDHIDELELMYTSKSIDCICKHNDTALLILWFDNCDVVELKYTSAAIDRASRYGYIEILDMWYDMRDKLELKYTSKSMNFGNLDTRWIVIWEWWFNRRDVIEFKYDPAIIFKLLHAPIISLEWWFSMSVAENFDLRLLESGLDNVVRFTHCTKECLRKYSYLFPYELHLDE